MPAFLTTATKGHHSNPCARQQHNSRRLAILVDTTTCLSSFPSFNHKLAKSMTTSSDSMKGCTRCTGRRAERVAGLLGACSRTKHFSYQGLLLGSTGQPCPQLARILEELSNVVHICILCPGLKLLSIFTCALQSKPAAV
jgi:hypothetical protein